MRERARTHALDEFVHARVTGSKPLPRTSPSRCPRIAPPPDTTGACNSAAGALADADRGARDAAVERAVHARLRDRRAVGAALDASIDRVEPPRAAADLDPDAFAVAGGHDGAGHGGDRAEARHPRAGGDATGALAGRALRRLLGRGLLGRRLLLGRDRRVVAPGVEEAEARAQRRAGHARGAARADDVRGDDARRGAAADHLHAAEPALHEPGELGRGRAHSHLHAPAVAWRDVVVGVLDRAQPRLRRPAEGVLVVLRAPAGGREEVGGDRLALVGDDLARGLRDGLVGRRLLDADAAVDLRAGVGVVLEAVAALGRGDRVRASGDGLRLERLQRPRGGRLDRHDALDVLVQRHGVDRVDAERARAQLEDAAVGAARAAVQRAALEHDPVCAAVDLQRGAVGAEPLAGRVLQVDLVERAAHDAVRLGRVQRARAGALGARDERGAARGLQQHPYGAGRLDGPEAGARVVVGQDVAVAGALLGVAHRAVLAHAHAVAEAGPADREPRGALGARGGEQEADRRENEKSGKSEHRWSKRRRYQSRTLARHVAGIEVAG